MHVSDINAIRDYIGLCERLSAMIEEDRMEIGHYLEGDAMRSYSELTTLEIDLLSDTKKLIDGAVIM